MEGQEGQRQKEVQGGEHRRQKIQEFDAKHAPDWRKTLITLKAMCHFIMGLYLLDREAMAVGLTVLSPLRTFLSPLNQASIRLVTR